VLINGDGLSQICEQDFKIPIEETLNNIIYLAW